MIERYKKASLQTTLEQTPALLRGSSVRAAQLKATPVANLSGAINQVESLSSRLASFANSEWGKYELDVKREAAKTATIDANKRAVEVNKRLSEGKDVDDLLAQQIKKDTSVYGKAYNTAYGTAYANEITLQAKEAADVAQVSAAGSSTAFYKAFHEYADKIVGAAPTKELAVIARQKLDLYGSGAYKSLALAETKRQEEAAKDNSVKTVQLLRKEFIQGDKLKRAKTSAQITTALTAAVKQGWLSEGAAIKELEDIKTEAYKEDTYNGFRATTDKVDYLDNFRKTSTLSTEETEQVIDRMHKMLRNEIEDKRILEEREKEEDAKFAQDLKDNFNVKLLEGQLTTDDLDEALSSHAITLSEYDEYQARMRTPGVEKGDDEVYQKYLIDIDTASLQDIYSDSRLSNTQKTQLIKERQSEEAKAYRSAVKQSEVELKNAFGIVEGTLIAKMDITNQLGKDFLRLQQELYDYTQTIDTEISGRERGAKALDFIRNKLEDYKAGKIVGTKPYQDNIDAEKNTVAEKPKEEDIKGKHSFIKMMMEKVGY